MSLVDQVHQAEGSLEVYASKDENSVPVAPKERLKSADRVRSIHFSLDEADRPSERNRSKVQDLKDFKPPLNQEILNLRGQGSRFNINFGEVATIINEAQSPYIDSFTSAEHLVQIKIKRKMFDPDDKEVYERILFYNLWK